MPPNRMANRSNVVVPRINLLRQSYWKPARHESSSFPAHLLHSLDADGQHQDTRLPAPARSRKVDGLRTPA